MMQPNDILRQLWGHSEFRPLQSDIIDSLMQGHDTFAILPTGGGKSICFQIPILAQKGCGLVISPLIALMNDQVEDLKSRGIPAEVIHSGLDSFQISNILLRAVHQELKFIYCSPERLTSSFFLDHCADIEWNYLIVDEAHCISEWGHDFRPQYLNIKEFKKNYAPAIPVGAFTASATVDTQAEIIKELALNQPRIFTQSTFRANINYHVLRVEQKPSTLLHYLDKSSNIIYCNTRAKTEQVTEFIRSHGYNANFYHAGLNNNERSFVQHQWIQSSNQTICSTNAFGMGINKPDVKQVFHLHTPSSLEGYYQEAGRAGRDGNNAYTYIIINQHDLNDLIRSIEEKYPPFEIVKMVYSAIFNHLMIADEEGYDEKHFIDLNVIKTKTKLKFTEILSAINIIETENYWVFNQDDTSKHHVLIDCDRNDMNDIEKMYPHLYELLIQMLRMYGDILHYKTPISIESIASDLNTTYDSIIQKLEQLYKLQFIKWDKYKKGSSIYFIQSRIPERFFTINQSRILKRKKIYAEKVKKIIQYINNSDICRQRLIGDYFGNSISNDCLICDNCKSKNFFIHKNNFQREIINHIKSKKFITIEELILRFQEKINPKEIHLTINEFINDDLISVKNNIIAST